MDSDDTTARTPEKLGLFWESELAKNPDGTLTVKAIEPVSHMSRQQAAKVLGCTAQVITNLFKLGILKGYKPGGWRLRSDGRASNAKLVVDSSSVLDYKKRQEQTAKEWQDAQ